MVCQYYDEDTQHWEDWPSTPNTECDVTNGFSLSISSSDVGATGAMDEFATYRPEKYVDTRIVYTSTSSLLEDDAGRVAIDTFKIHFIETCYDLDITVSAGVNAEYIYLTHANSGNLDVEATYGFANDNTCTKTRVAWIKPEGTPADGWVSIPSGTYPFIALHSTYGVRINHQLAANEYDAPLRFDVWIDVSTASDVASHAAAN